MPTALYINLLDFCVHNNVGGEVLPTKEQWADFIDNSSNNLPPVKGNEVPDSKTKERLVKWMMDKTPETYACIRYTSHYGIKYAIWDSKVKAILADPKRRKLFTKDSLDKFKAGKDSKKRNNDADFVDVSAGQMLPDGKARATFAEMVGDGSEVVGDLGGDQNGQDEVVGPSAGRELADRERRGGQETVEDNTADDRFRRGLSQSTGSERASAQAAQAPIPESLAPQPKPIADEIASAREPSLQPPVATMMSAGSNARSEVHDTGDGRLSSSNEQSVQPDLMDISSPTKTFTTAVAGMNPDAVQPGSSFQLPMRTRHLDEPIKHVQSDVWQQQAEFDNKNTIAELEIAVDRLRQRQYNQRLREVKADAEDYRLQQVEGRLRRRDDDAKAKATRLVKEEDGLRQKDEALQRKATRIQRDEDRLRHQDAENETGARTLSRIEQAMRVLEQERAEMERFQAQVRAEKKEAEVVKATATKLDQQSKLWCSDLQAREGKLKVSGDELDEERSTLRQANREEKKQFSKDRDALTAAEADHNAACVARHNGLEESRRVLDADILKVEQAIATTKVWVEYVKQTVEEHASLRGLVIDWYRHAPVKELLTGRDEPPA